ncbi:MAG TPA: DUF1540 domain-containing protein [Syntrophomonadaceae bacterium]|nr:DUF1540 domain-containing protein [Syntrophomonadaceae bacterium]
MSKVMQCMCEECYHNDSFQCRAEGIEVRSSSEGRQVQSSEGTCCNTFKHGKKK